MANNIVKLVDNAQRPAADGALYVEKLPAQRDDARSGGCTVYRSKCVRHITGGT